MKIVIIRHADPDLANNTLTKKGIKEAKALGKFYSDKDFDYVYCSPLNRAKLTAQAVIKKKKIIYKDYLKEFIHPFPYKGELLLNWDFLPQTLDNKDFEDQFYLDNFLDNKYFKFANIKENYLRVVNEFDKTLENHGYKRYKHYYRVTKPNKDTIVFFCHFGIMSVLLSHLLNVPFTMISQYTCCLPTGVTTLYSEERRKNIAQFRMCHFGDLTHLTVKGIEPSFSARFCELYTDKTRHD